MSGCDCDRDQLADRLTDAVEQAMSAHEPLDNDSRCACGARNNMDGDVLHSHRVSVVSDAIGVVLDEYIVRAAVPDRHGDERC